MESIHLHKHTCTHAYILEIKLCKYQFGDIQHGGSENEQKRQSCTKLMVNQTPQGVTESRLMREGILGAGEKQGRENLPRWGKAWEPSGTS